MGVFRFVVGGVVGASAALLLTPRTGKENRAALMKRVDSATDRGGQAVQYGREAIYDKVRTVNPEAADAVNDAVNSASQGVGDVAQAASSAADDIRDRINEARDRIAEQVTQDHNTARPVEADISDVVEGEADGAVDDVTDRSSKEGSSESSD
ncbi:MAG: YtxH domain-containing protein [Coriobacteriaceae bacterium]|nr:YtxH domain-containing protein [Coriobacteriaceae bacterium]